MIKSNWKLIKEGLIDGVPIGLGYFAVAFSLGILATKANLTAFQGFVASLLCNASAGEYAGFLVIISNASYLQMIIMTLVANMRYLLMSASLSQRCDKDLNIKHRLILSFYITDEIFGITIARKGKLNPYYTYGAILPATLMWSLGTAIGIIAGEVLPTRIVSALSVALYGMFLAIIIPPCKEDKRILCLIITSFTLSFLGSYYLPYLKDLSNGTRTIILTIIIASIASIMWPRREDA